MPFRYAPLSNHISVHDRELEASFEADGDNSDSDDDQHGAQAESRPLNTSRSRSSPPTGSGSAYNFENLDYDYPPPGSPPRPSGLAIPNNQIGNSNGLIPQSSYTPSSPQRSSWFRRAAMAVLPSSSRPSSSPRPVGGGIENDGVFANINAKPSRGRIITDGDSGVYVVPEEIQKDAPPSYASAQADAVPPYWETTILAPSTFGGPGEMMVDGLPTGSFFSFLWNLLVSMSFQFVGFLLTFLLHSTHAAKLGSRAGLGITLIRYGFYLRTRADSYGGGDVILDDDPDRGNWWPSPTISNAPRPTFEKASAAEDYYSKSSSSTNFTSFPLSSSPAVVRPVISEATAEWISFLLMTIGWFILLTSTLSFWRVKRWERSIMASTLPDETANEGTSHASNSLHALERFGFPGAIWRNFHPSTLHRADGPDDEEAILESGGVRVHVQPTSEEDLDAAARRARAVLMEARLQHDLRSAGLL